ncbi:MAG: hypothetical protein WBQ08_19720 [Candidatus Sulfotelmatobacter sp.]
MKKQILHLKHVVALLTLVVLSATGLANSQTGQTPTMTPASQDITRWQFADFSMFLESHPEVAGQLQKDPSLIDNREFVESHPELQQFLREHPKIREESEADPVGFMRREDRYEHDHDSEITRRDLALMDQFLDKHPEVAEQLEKDPSLIDNREFIEHHPELKEFLAEHPELRQAFKDNSNEFMHREERFDASEGARDPRWELASMDQFLDRHPEIAEQVRKDPSLLDNKKFLAAHPALEGYLQQHPEIRQEIDKNPTAFMRQEDRFDRGEGRGQEGWDRDTNRGELASFHQFLGSHSTIADQLTKNPELAKNDEYMEGHPEFRQYLQANPSVREQLTENPRAFVNSAEQFNENSATSLKGMAPKAPAFDSKPKQ